MRPPIDFQPGWPMYTALMNGLPMQQPIKLTTPSAVSTRVVASWCSIASVCVGAGPPTDRVRAALNAHLPPTVERSVGGQRGGARGSW